MSIPYFVWEKLPRPLKIGDTCQFQVKKNEQGYWEATSVDVVGYDPDVELSRSEIIEKRMKEKQRRIDEAILQKKALKITNISLTKMQIGGDFVQAFTYSINRVRPRP